MKIRTILLIIKVVGVFSCLLSAGIWTKAEAKKFQDGDMVCFWRDSITHAGKYQYYILEYYATRFPGDKLIFCNCGISGDSAKGALKRLSRDVLDRKPTKTVIMLGMDDVGRELYGRDKPSDKLLSVRNDRIAVYKEYMKKIAHELEKNNIGIIYITPSPYDQTAEIKSKNLFGVNDVLGKCTEFCREEASRNNTEIIDLHAPMIKLNLKNQAADPAFTLIGTDRVHPGGTGHFIMAYLFLKQQGVPALISSINLNYKKTALISEKNCKVTNLEKEKTSLTFNCLEESLPLSLSKEYKAADKLMPISENLNREIVTVSDLTIRL